MSIAFQKQEGSSSRKVFCEEIVLKYFAKFGGNVLLWNPHFRKFAGHWANLTQSQRCLTFLLIELQMLLRCCLIHISIIILWHFLCLVYLCPCLALRPFMSYLCHLFFISIFILINHIISLKQSHVIFLHFLEYALLFLDITFLKNANNFQKTKSSASAYCLAFAWFFYQFQPGATYKSVAYKKSVYVIWHL